MHFCSVNGSETKNISSYDKGLAFGDGIFTTAKICNGQIELLDAHLQRIKLGCKQLALPEPDYMWLQQYITTQATQYSLAVLKVIITSGCGGRGYSRQNQTSPTIVVQISAFPTHYSTWQKNGISVGIAKQQLGISPLTAGIKHLNRLEQVLIKRELEQTEFDDLLVENCQNFVIESSCANIFWFENGQLFTPELTLSGVNGIIRQQILASVPCKLVNTSITNLPSIEAMFLCNALMHIVPVKQLANRVLSIEPVIQFKESYL